ncbi:MAG: PilZ domain-containing protein [Acidobacteriota bacterium]|nr:PilZ domain-containing protein [Acidobacteriota bacterium]
MNDDKKQESLETDSPPRNQRVPVNFSLILEGRTSAGEQFSVTADAVRVSRGGATLITPVAVEPGSTVVLKPPFGRVLEAEVNGVWVDEVDNQQRIGVKLKDRNGWFAE